jgi:hypothetical protein
MKLIVDRFESPLKRPADAPILGRDRPLGKALFLKSNVELRLDEGSPSATTWVATAPALTESKWIPHDKS